MPYIQKDGVGSRALFPASVVGEFQLRAARQIRNPSIEVAFVLPSIPGRTLISDSKTVQPASEYRGIT